MPDFDAIAPARSNGGPAPERIRAAEVGARVTAALAIAREVAAMPDTSDMTDDEILGYDEDGIPSR